MRSRMYAASNIKMPMSGKPEIGARHRMMPVRQIGRSPETFERSLSLAGMRGARVEAWRNLLTGGSWLASRVGVEHCNA